MGLSRACALVRAAAAAAFAVPAARAASLGQGGQPFRPLDEALISHRALRYRHILGRSFRTLGPPLAAGWSAAWLGTPGAAAEKRWLRPPRKPSANQSRRGAWAAHLGRPIRQEGPPECRTVRLTCACLRHYGSDCDD
mmetsp:Transcript_88665/g.264506  ORF Transcript_88665/g.264506 Transcript_88665/m.264506 type:complete len:138 (+) Transcript_88665:50-463(+)